MQLWELQLLFLQLPFIVLLQICLERAVCVVDGGDPLLLLLPSFLVVEAVLRGVVASLRLSQTLQAFKGLLFVLFGLRFGRVVGVTPNSFRSYVCT